MVSNYQSVTQPKIKKIKKVDKKMKKTILLFLLISLNALFIIYLISSPEKAEAAILDSSPDVFVLTTVEPSSTPTPYLTPVVVITPSPIPTPELPTYPYPKEEARDISRAIFSVTPENPTYDTKKALAEIPQNMVDDYKKREQNHEKTQNYKENIRYCLLMDTEFPSFNSLCYRNLDEFDKRKLENDEIADYVMRSWWYANITGDRSYRLTPQSGVRYSFYNVNGWDYIKVYDLNWDLVYDSGKDI